MEHIIKLLDIENNHKEYVDTIKEEGLEVNDVLHYLWGKYQETKDVKYLETKNDSYGQKVKIHTKFILQSLKESNKEHEKIIKECEELIEKESE